MRAVESSIDMGRPNNNQQTRPPLNTQNQEGQLYDILFQICAKENQNEVEITN